MKNVMHSIIFILCLSALFCSNALAKDTYKIITACHQIFSSYDFSLKGFVDGINKSEIGRQVQLETYNAQDDLNNLDNFIDSLKNRKDIDLIYSIGTVTTKKMVNEIHTIPIIFTDLGEPETSGVIKDWKGSGSNYTGVETRNYVSISIKLLHELINFKSIGMIYLNGAPSHEGTVKRVTNLSKELGFDFVFKGVAYRDENNNRYSKEIIRQNMKEAIDYVAPKVDVFYVQISATFERNFDLLFDSFKKYSIPSAGEPIYIKKGLVIGIGRHKEKFGSQCAAYAVRILKDGADPGTMPMDTGTEFAFSLNLEAAAIVGYNPSIDILGAADQIYKELAP